MKLTDRDDVVDVQGTGEREDINFGIDPSKMGRFWRMMFEYSNPLASFVRELTSNAVDSHIEARAYKTLSLEELLSAGYGQHIIEGGGTEEGKLSYIKGMKEIFKDWQDRNVTVELEAANMADDTPDMIRFIDYGVGMSPERIYDIYTKFGTSTKSSIDELIGAFGLGAKSPIGYADMFIVKTVWVGMEYTYAVHRTAQAPAMKPLSESLTDKPNGTTVEIALRKGEFELAQKAIREQLAYFDGVDYVNTNTVPGSIFEGEHFLFRQNTPFSKIHLCLGKAYYPLDLSAIGFEHEEPPPIALRVPLHDMTGPDPLEGHVSIVWNRESVQYNSETIEYLKAKYKLAVEEIKHNFKEKEKEIEDFDQWFKIGQNSVVNQFELFPGVFMPRVSGILKWKTEWPKYADLPRLPWGNNIFQHWEVRRRVDEGKMMKLKSLPQVFEVIRGDEITSNMFYMDGHSYSPQKNRYLAYEGYDRFYLIKYRTSSQEDLGLPNWSMWNTFGFYNSNPPTPEQIRLMESFMREVDDWIEANYLNYEEIEVSKEFKSSEKVKLESKRAEKIKRVRGDDEFPARFLTYKTVETQEGFERRFSWTMGNYSQWDATNHTRLVIYGTQEDEEFLLALSNSLISNFWLRSTFTYSGETVVRLKADLDPKKAMVIKVARANQDHFKGNPNAMHVRDFVASRNRVLVRYVTAYGLIRRLPVGLSTLASPEMDGIDRHIHRAAKALLKYVNTYYLDKEVHQMDEALLDQFQQLEKDRLAAEKRNQKLWENIVKKFPEAYQSPARQMHFRKHKLPVSLPFLDYYAVDLFKEVQKYIIKYPLLLSLDLKTADKSNVKEYLRAMGRRGV